MYNHSNQSKITKKSHKSIVKESEPLHLIHFDICEFDGTLTRNGKRYFITFIDDCSDYTDVVLVHEHRGVPDGLIVCHLPFGPTAYFGLLNVASTSLTVSLIDFLGTIC